MSYGAGNCTRAGNHANADPLEFLRGVMFGSPADVVYIDDYATEHDTAEIDHLAELDAA